MENEEQEVRLSTPLLSVRELTVKYGRRTHGDSLTAVDEVDFTIAEHQTVGLVGESGSGKSTIGKAILGLVPVTTGTIAFAGRDITRLSKRERRKLSTQLQVVFQDPYSSLNPTRTIGQTLRETVLANARVSRVELDRRVRAILDRVGLPSNAEARYPGQFSGGQRQRVVIARALIVDPRLVICDEPVSALDISVQAQVLNLFRELQDELELSYLFIAHDLAVVRHVSHRIVLLYRGQIMEAGDAASVYSTPVHPYTRALIEASPVPNPEVQRARRLGQARRSVESDAGVGCPFASRCTYAIELCHAQRPAREVADDGRTVACHRWREISTDRSSARDSDPVGRGQYG